MPPSRRLRLTLVAVAITVLLYFHYYSSPDPSSPASYMNTLREMHNSDAARAAAKAKLQASLHEAAAKGRKLANEKAPAPKAAPDPNKPPPPPPTDLQKEGDEKSVNAGEAKPIDPEKAAREGKVVLSKPERIGEEEAQVSEAVRKVEEVEKKAEEDKEKEKKIEAGRKPDEQSALHDEIAKLLNKGPIIIFSKTTCPYSTRAKTILLRHYAITPTPVVIELDQHPLGTEIQGWLENFTGRKTVPNILVNSKSIGGSDDIAKLDDEGKLEAVIREAAGNQVSEIKKVVGDSKEHR